MTTVKAVAIGLALDGLAILVPRVCAARDAVVALQFVAFSEDGEHYLLRRSDADEGTAFSLHETETGKVLSTTPFEMETEPQVETRLKKKNKLTDPGKDGQTSEDGMYTVLGAPSREPGKYDVLVMKRGKTARLGSVELHKDSSSGAIAAATLQRVHWRADKREVVVIIHEKLGGNWGLDADFATPFAFLPHRLHFE